MRTPQAEWVSALQDHLDQSIASADDIRRRGGPHVSAAMDGWITRLHDLRKQVAALPNNEQADTQQPNA